MAVPPAIPSAAPPCANDGLVLLALDGAGQYHVPELTAD